MQVMHQEVGRAWQRERLEQAQAARLGYQLTRARRLSRRAERAAAAARLALARVL